MSGRGRASAAHRSRPGSPDAVAGLAERTALAAVAARRPLPDAAARWSVADAVDAARERIAARVEAGQTVCLIEVMKTFHRVTYGGGDLPDQASVVEILVGDDADVTAGQPLLALASAP